jgi:hypothetical protein
MLALLNFLMPNLGIKYVGFAQLFISNMLAFSNLLYKKIIVRKKTIYTVIVYMVVLFLKYFIITQIKRDLYLTGL